MKSKSIVVATMISLTLTQACLSENMERDVVFTDGNVSIVVAAQVETEEGASHEVNTRFSGDGNSSGHGSSATSSGDFVGWSYFYVDETQTSWGNPNNPDLYVKIWYDHSGRIDVNCFHVSVPNILCGAGLADANGALILGSEATNVVTMQKRYTRLTLEPGANGFVVAE